MKIGQNSKGLQTRFLNSSYSIRSWLFTSGLSLSAASLSALLSGCFIRPPQASPAIADFTEPPPATELVTDTSIRERQDGTQRAIAPSASRLAAIPTQPEWVLPELFLSRFPSFSSPRLDAQIRLYASYLALNGPPDILIIGSSRSLQGIDPARLEAELSAQGYADLSVYNFGVNGATAQVVDLMVRQLLTPEQLPQMILWGDGSRAFNNGRSDATYQQIVASNGYAYLQAGQHPIAYGSSRWAGDRFCLEPSPLDSSFNSSLEPSLEASGENGFETGSVEQYFMNWADWGVLCDQTVNGTERPRRWERDRPILQQRWINQYGTGLNRQGFLPVATVFDPVAYYQQYPRVPGAYDADYVPFELEGEQAIATARLAAYLQSHNVPLVFVNLPLTNDYLDSFRQQREQLFWQHMAQMAQREGFLVRNLNQAELSLNQYFADPSHLNQAGAQAVATYLARDATLPWKQRR